MCGSCDTHGYRSAYGCACAKLTHSMNSSIRHYFCGIKWMRRSENARPHTHCFFSSYENSPVLWFSIINAFRVIWFRWFGKSISRDERWHCISKLQWGEGRINLTSQFIVRSDKIGIWQSIQLSLTTLHRKNCRIIHVVDVWLQINNRILPR